MQPEPQEKRKTMRSSGDEQALLLCLLRSYEAYGVSAPWPDCFGAAPGRGRGGEL